MPKKSNTVRFAPDTKEEPKKQDTDEEINNEEGEEDIENETEEEVEGEDEGEEELYDENKDDETCPYMPAGKRSNGVNKISARIDKEDEDDDEFDEVNAQLSNTSMYVLPEERISSKLMTKFEMVRLISSRRVQLESGAKPMIKHTSNLSPKEIAHLELEKKRIPLVVIRPLPNGKREIWKVTELILKKEFIKAL